MKIWNVKALLPDSSVKHLRIGGNGYQSVVSSVEKRLNAVVLECTEEVLFSEIPKIGD